MEHVIALNRMKVLPPKEAHSMMPDVPGVMAIFGIWPTSQHVAASCPTVSSVLPYSQRRSVDELLARAGTLAHEKPLRMQFYYNEHAQPPQTPLETNDYADYFSKVLRSLRARQRNDWFKFFGAVRRHVGLGKPMPSRDVVKFHRSSMFTHPEKRFEIAVLHKEAFAFVFSQLRYYEANMTKGIQPRLTQLIIARFLISALAAPSIRQKEYAYMVPFIFQWLDVIVQDLALRMEFLLLVEAWGLYSKATPCWYDVWGDEFLEKQCNEEASNPALCLKSLTRHHELLGNVVTAPRPSNILRQTCLRCPFTTFFQPHHDATQMKTMIQTAKSPGHTMMIPDFYCDTYFEFPLALLRRAQLVHEALGIE